MLFVFFSNSNHSFKSKWMSVFFLFSFEQHFKIKILSHDLFLCFHICAVCDTFPGSVLYHIIQIKSPDWSYKYTYLNLATRWDNWKIFFPSQWAVIFHFIVREFAEIQVITRFSLQCVLLRMCIEIVYPQRKACVLSLHALTCLDFCLLVFPSRLLERESLLSQQDGKACKASSQQEPRACCWACTENSQTRPGLASSLPPPSNPASYA